MPVCCSNSKFIPPSLLIALIDTCAENNFLVIYLSCQNRFNEVVYHLKQLFHMICDKGDTSAKALLSFSFILQIVAWYDDL